METKYLKIVMLAAIADGMVQNQELELINQIQRNHPEMKSVPESAAKAAMADIYNKLSAGMEPKHILEQLSGEFTKEQKFASYALAKEVCAADFHMQPAETEFLSLIEEIWGIPKKVADAVNQSIKLRYFT